MGTQVLLKVDYSDNTGKYWSESYIKNEVFNIDAKESIHNEIAKILEAEDGCILSYKNKPISNMYVDLLNGESKAIGYVYRGKQEILNDKLGKYVTVNFDVWVAIKMVSDFEIIELN